MEQAHTRRTQAIFGAAVLALTLGVISRRPTRYPQPVADEMRDAVAAPISPALLGGARMIPMNAGYFASPIGRRAEAENVLISSRKTKASKLLRARAAARKRVPAIVDDPQ